MTGRSIVLGKRPMSRAQGGFTYLAILFVVAIASVALSGVGVLWSFEHQREKEKQLLAIGREFRTAIGSYYEGSPGMVKRYPSSIQDLLKDNRFLFMRRHLRQVYVDPMTGGREWGLVLAPEGGIMGVYSLSTDAAIKRNNFPLIFEQLENKARYDEWKFIYRSPSLELQGRGHK